MRTFKERLGASWDDMRWSAVARLGTDQLRFEYAYERGVTDFIRVVEEFIEQEKSWDTASGAYKLLEFVREYYKGRE